MDKTWNQYLSSVQAKHFIQPGINLKRDLNGRKKNKKKSPGSATIRSRIQSLTPRERGKTQKPTSAIQTNAPKARRPAVSSPSEIIAMLKGQKTQDETLY